MTTYNYYSSFAQSSCDGVLNELNNFQPVVIPTMPIKDMGLNIKYDIKSAKMITTKFGNRIVLRIEAPNFESHNLFLPERFNGMSQDTLDAMNAGEITIQNQGPLGKSFMLLFNKN